MSQAEKKQPNENDFGRFHYGYTNRDKCPCKDCKDRNAECHSTCEPYLEYEKQKMETRNKVEERWQREESLWGHETLRRRRKETAWRHKNRK